MNWLSLKVSESEKPKVFISIPKKTAPRAVRRNRLKRLVREALRRQPKNTAELWFKVLRDPGEIGLKEAEAKVRELLNVC